MSRKIGLCDVHFDPDIEGDIDFDFFGEEEVDEADDGAFDRPRYEMDKTATDRPKSATRSASQISGKSTFNGEHVDDGDSVFRMASIEDDEDVCLRHVVVGGRRGRDQNRDKEEDEEETWQSRTSEPYNSSSSNGLQISSSQVKLEPCLVTPNLAIETVIDRKIGHANRLPLESQQQQQEQQQPMERSLTPKDLLRVTATEMRFGSPLSSDSDSASDLYSLTDEEEEEEEASFDVSDSEITDVSPLSSAAMSPLPESPRRRTPEPARSSSKFGSFSPRPAGRSLSAAKAAAVAAGRPQWGCNGKSKAVFADVAAAAAMSTSESSKETSIDLKLLAKAILELEEERKTKRDDSVKDGSGSGGSSSTMQVGSTRGTTRSNSSALFGQHSESSACSRVSSHSRKNLSFTNDEVRRIEQENKRLLRRIIDSQKPRRTSTSATHFFPMHSTTGKLASSAVNRMRELKKIETENLAMLKRLQAAKPTKELSRDFLLKSSGGGVGSGRSGSVFGGSMQQYGTCTTPQPSSRSSSQSIGSSNVARGRHGTGSAGRSMSTGSLASTLASCSTTNRNYSGRSRSLKLPNVTAGSVGLGHQTPPPKAAATAGGER